MQVLTISEARKNLAAVVASVIDDDDEALIPRGNGKAVVIMSLDRWNSINETLHLMGNPVNARHLLDSIAQADDGRLIQADLIDDADDATGQ